MDSSLLLFHGTDADFAPAQFRIGMPSTTIPVGGGAPAPVRNCAAFFTTNLSIAGTYGRRVLQAELSTSARIYDPQEFDWRLFENNPRTAMELRKHGYDAVRFREGDVRFETIAVLDVSVVRWRHDVVDGLSTGCADH